MKATGEGRGATGGDEEIERAAAEDAVLMARVRTGDEAAMGVLIGRWELPVKRVIARIVFNVGEAEELAQETMVRVWQKREQFRAGAAVRPWIFAIAVNVARNRLRWWRRRPTIALEEWSETEDGEREGRREGETRRTGDGGGLERAERAAAVQAAVAALPGELREALVLFEYEGLRQAEIAAMLGCSVKAVESRVARAKEKLRAALMRWA
jgi:RNA polymerase sigma-70 factor (ECF subfamily)